MFWLCWSCFVSSFGFASELFRAVGADYVVVVIGLVILSVVTRLFIRVVVGPRLDAAGEALAKQGKFGRVSTFKRRVGEAWRAVNHLTVRGKYQKRR